jgi:16S rRNA G966 N2-methylase RsmD
LTQIEKAESYTGIFGMHKYWSKKPHNIIKSLICENSKKGDIVLDPFCGSGISIIQSILSGRNGIGIDLNPMAIFITEQTLSKIDPSLIDAEFKKIKKDVEYKINSLYQVKRGKKSFIGTHYVWKNGVLEETWYKEDKKKVVSKSTKTDIDFAKSFSYSDIPYFYPKTELIPNSRINAKKSMFVYDLFTPRNIHGLSMLFDRINKIKNKELRKLFQFCFTASLGQSSKMVFVIEKRGETKIPNTMPRKEIGSWVIGYWIPKQNFEINIWSCFKNRYTRILKAKKEQFLLDYKLKPVTKFSELKNNNVLLSNQSALDYLKSLHNDSIDYIITDPPHGDRLPYLELSLMWNSWLQFDISFEKELVVSDAKSRDKNVSNYNQFFKLILIEIRRVLKPKKKFTLMFNSLDDESWKSILEIIYQSKLELTEITTLSYSANSVVQDNRKKGLETDFVLHFAKTSKKSVKLISLSDKDEVKEIQILVNEFKKQNNTFRSFEIINHVVIGLLKKKIFFNLSKILQQI